MRRHPALPLLFATLAIMLAGCFNPFDPRVSNERAASSPAPAPSSAQNVVKLFVWCWQHRDPARYSEVFTDDYRFIFAPNDSAGNPFRDRPWLREDEMNMAQHMFSGGADVPPASDVSITIDNQLNVTPDSRPGHSLSPAFKTIRTHVDLKVTVTDASGTPSVTLVTGYVRFYLVRGDSAEIPAELVAKGFRPDPNRWWIGRWEDLTVGTGAAAARPVTGTPRPLTFGLPTAVETYTRPPATVGQLKQYYWLEHH